MHTSTTKTSPPSTAQVSTSEVLIDPIPSVESPSPTQSLTKLPTSSPKRGSKLSEPLSPIEKEEPCSSELPKEETGFTICLDWAKAQRIKTGNLGTSPQKTTPWSTLLRLNQPRKPCLPLLSSKNTWRVSPMLVATSSRKSGSSTGKSLSMVVTT